jgi:hypothetical protein
MKRAGDIASSTKLIIKPSGPRETKTQDGLGAGLRRGAPTRGQVQSVRWPDRR